MDRADDASRAAPLTPVAPAFVFTQAQVAALASLLLLEADQYLSADESRIVPDDPAQVFAHACEVLLRCWLCLCV